MNRLKEEIKKKWKLLTGITVIFMMVFMAGFAVKAHFMTRAADTTKPDYKITDDESNEITGSMAVRRVVSNLTISQSGGGTNGKNTKYTWKSMNTDILVLGAAEEGTVEQTGYSGTVQLKVKSTGTVALQIIAEHPDGDVQIFNISVTVIFSVNEYMSEGSSGAKMDRIFISDSRKSLIMDYDTELEFGESAVTETSKLNMIFGNARSQEASWQSNNLDVIEIKKDGTENDRLIATGPGRATLSVTYTDGTSEFKDQITVYVRPKVYYKTSVSDPGTQIDNTSSLVMNTGEYIDCKAKFANNPLESISNKLVWVISKNVGSETYLVRDSLGNASAEYGEEAKLVYAPSAGMYQLQAKAGKYFVQFYVVGTYRSFDEAKASTPGCGPVNIGTGVQVKSTYGDKVVTINIGGNYSLADAFNITSNDLKSCLDYTIVNDTTNNGNNYINVNENTWIVTTKAVGTAEIKVKKKSDTVDSNIPDFDNFREVTVKITVANTFSLNVSDVDMSIGSSQTLYGIFGTDIVAEADQFKWTTSDTDNTYIDISANGKYATITAKKETESNQSVTVTLAFTNSEGVTLTASCNVTVRRSVDSFHMIPEELTIKQGEQSVISTDLTESRKLIWLSSDESVGTIEQIEGTTNPSAMFTALKAGKTVITALNPDNNVFATCTVIVTQPVTELAIGVVDQDTKEVVPYDTYTTTLAMKYVFMKAIFGPSDTTESETDFIWSVEGTSLSDVRPTDIAEIDSSGKVTMKREGDVYIKLQSANMYATCHLIIQSRPMTEITTDVSSLDMIKGDTYSVVTSYLPEDASDTRMIWTSDDEKIAKVSDAGVITAVGPGTTSIKVSAVLPQSDDNHTIATATIVVNVRERLNSISFGSKAEYIAVGSSKSVEVKFTPSENVNKNVTYSSSDTTIFTVSKEGVITGVKEGVAMLSCVAEDLGQNGAVTCMVYVTSSQVSATDFSIIPNEDTVYIGSTLTLVPVFTPENVTDRDVTWTTSDETKATVDANGVVTGVAEGTTVITATYKDTTNDNKVWTSTCIVNVEKAPIPAEGFEVSPTTKNIVCGKSFTITAKFTPEDTTNQNVIYQSLDETVVTVDTKGVVTGVGPGDAIVQCTTEDGGFNATVAVHVEKAVDFKLSPSTRELALGHSFTPKKVIKPTTANKTATWKTSNSKIATVSSSGKVKAKKIGTCTITCTLTKYNQSSTCKIKVRKLRTSVKLNKSNIRIGLKQSYRLKATVDSNAGKTPGVTWKSSNTRILKVSSSGKITAKRVGIARVTVMTKDAIHAKASCKVRVIRRVSSIKLNTNYTVCYVGRSKKLHAILKPSTASVKNVKWTTSDKNIVQVNGNGKIWGIAEGDAYITATTTDGSNKKAKCFVKVVEPVPVTSIVIAQQDVTMKSGDSMKLSYSVLPSDNSDSIKFSSDNERVATVSSNGTVKAVGTGNATITILATSGVTATVNINVVAMNKSVLNLRQYDTETLIVHGTSDPITWYSSNTRVAVVTNGKVVAKGIGTAYIYAYVNGCKVGCQINVTSVNNKNR